MKYIIPILIFYNHILFSQTQPAIKPIPSTDQYFERKIIDEYRNIENVEDSTVTNWMKGQNSYANSILQSIPNRQYLINKLDEIDNKKSTLYLIYKLQIIIDIFILKHRPEKISKSFISGMDLMEKKNYCLPLRTIKRIIRNTLLII